MCGLASCGSCGSAITAGVIHSARPVAYRSDSLFAVLVSAHVFVFFLGPVDLGRGVHIKLFLNQIKRKRRNLFDSDNCHLILKSPGLTLSVDVVVTFPVQKITRRAFEALASQFSSPMIRWNSVPSVISDRCDLALGWFNRNLGDMLINGFLNGIVIWRLSTWKKLAGVVMFVTIQLASCSDLVLALESCQYSGSSSGSSFIIWRNRSSRAEECSGPIPS